MRNKKPRNFGVGTGCLSILMAITSLCSGCSGDGRKNEKKDRVFSDTARNVFIDLRPLFQNAGAFQPVDVNVKYDPFFQTNKSYRGYPIIAVLDSIIKSNGIDKNHNLVVFVCQDGYQPSMERSVLYGKAKGYLAFKDLAVQGKANWPDSIQKRFAPFYLVWDDVKKEDHEHAWPFGLIGLRFTTTAAEYSEIYPSGDAALERGFELYRNACMKCHSINKVGGTFGPEFNYPRNITTYWQDKDMIAFARNPKAYRYNSHMPEITGIEDKDFEMIIKYIRSMKDKKPADR